MIVSSMALALVNLSSFTFDAEFKDGDYIFFGSETAGIPEEVLNKYKDKNITIPMTKEGRSLNLAISTGIILYDAIRQTFDSFEV